MIYSSGPVFWHDLCISRNCDETEYSYSILGEAYGEGPGANETTLFGERDFRVSDYEVFKIEVCVLWGYVFGMCFVS
jgi:hypothetical protein